MRQHPEFSDTQPGALFGAEFQEYHGDPMAELILEIHRTEWEYARTQATKEYAA